MLLKTLLALSLFVALTNCAPQLGLGFSCKNCNTGSKWPPYENADSSKGYWELKAEKAEITNKVKKSPTAEEIEAATSELKPSKIDDTQTNFPGGLKFPF